MSIKFRIKKFIGRSYPVLLTLPAVIWIFAVCIYPTAQVIWLSFWGAERGRLDTFAGLSHYMRWFTDDYFHMVMYNTFYITFIGVALRLLVGLLIALMLVRSKLTNYLMPILLLPWSISGVVISIMLKWMVDPAYGLLNYFLMDVIPLLNKPYNYMANAETARWMIILGQTWGSIPYAAVVLVAAIQAIPRDIYESAQVDGANTLQRFRYITIPWLVPAIQYLAIINTVFGLRSFIFIWILTMGGPGGATEVYGTYLYRQFFEYLEQGWASSIGVFMMILNFIIVVIFTKTLRARVY